MKNRIKLVRKQEGLSQEKFAKSLNLSPTFVHFLENGIRQPSNRTILDICRIYGISEEWLRTGEGEMRVSVMTDAQVNEILHDILMEEPGFKNRLISVLIRMTPEEWKMLEDKINEISDK